MSLTDRISSSPERMKIFQQGRLEMEITEHICELMEAQNVSRAELARRLGKSAPYVTKMLRSGSNLTVKTISDVFFALGKSVRILPRPISISSPELIVMEIHPVTEKTVAHTKGGQYNKLMAETNITVVSPPTLTNGAA